MPKIMVVDDDKDVIYTIRTLFEEWGYETLSADSGKKCLELLRDKKIPDCILLDIMMPGMNGWEVHEKLKRNPKWKNIPVIYVTAVQDKTSRITCRLLADGYVDKPFQSQELKQTIDELLKEKNKLKD
jgi:putative two-component system response regulator